MKLVNLTGTDLNIYSEDETRIIATLGAFSFAPKLVRVPGPMNAKPTRTIEVEGASVPIYRQDRTWYDIQGLPDPQDDTLFIIPPEYAYKGLNLGCGSDILVPSRPVFRYRESDGIMCLWGYKAFDVLNP